MLFLEKCYCFYRDNFKNVMIVKNDKMIFLENDKSDYFGELLFLVIGLKDEVTGSDLQGLGFYGC